MTRHEQDREDLLQEATALCRRIELRVGDDPRSIVIGFRRDGSCSLFFGQELVFQFNTRHALRRGYWNGRLIKAESKRLVALTRVRTENETQLVRHEFTPEETAEYMSVARRNIQSLRADLRSDDVRVVGRVPEDTDVLKLARDWLDTLPPDIPIAARAGVRAARSAR